MGKAAIKILQDKEVGPVAAVTVVGSLNMDLVIRAPRRPRRGETILGGAFGMTGGGKGSNQALAAARLDAEAFMVGAVGDDDSAGDCGPSWTRAGSTATAWRSMKMP
mgnify:CR=1 FL=1